MPLFSTMTTARRLSSFLILYHSALSRYVDANDEINQCHASVDTIDNDNPTCNNYSWNWDVDAKHRCNIKKMSFNELYSVFESGLPPLYHEPVILYNEHPNVEDSSHCLASKFKEMMSFENITKTFSKDFEVTLSSSNSFSAHRRTTTLDEYINESMTKEILPHQLSNMTWYLFGETYSVDWKNVLKHYCLPPCQTCTTELRYERLNFKNITLLFIFKMFMLMCNV